MYNALDEQYMFQEMHDREGGCTRGHAQPGTPRAGDRRWWRRGTRRAR